MKIKIKYNLSKLFYTIGDLFSKLPWYWSAKVYSYFMGLSSNIQENNFQIGAWSTLTLEQFEEQFGYHSEYELLCNLENYLNNLEDGANCGLCRISYYNFDRYMDSLAYLMQAYKQYSGANNSDCKYWFNDEFDKKQRLYVINLAKHNIINETGY